MFFFSPPTPSVYASYLPLLALALAHTDTRRNRTARVLLHLSQEAEVFVYYIFDGAVYQSPRYSYLCDTGAPPGAVTPRPPITEVHDK